MSLLSLGKIINEGSSISPIDPKARAKVTLLPRADHATSRRETLSRRRGADLIIETWRESYTPRQLSLPAPYSAAAATVGVLGAALAHLAIISALTLNFKGDSSRLAPKASEDRRPSLVLLMPIVEDSTASVSPFAETRANDLARIAIDSRQIASRHAVFKIEDESDSLDQNEAPSDVRQRQFGIYTGQIIARVERAWLRPRTPVLSAGAARSEFVCQVKVLQTVSGLVSEVDFLDCNGGRVWQQSLVHAIFSASPLPAPPSPTVFEDALTLTFSAAEFRAGDAEDGYILADSNDLASGGLDKSVPREGDAINADKVR